MPKPPMPPDLRRCPDCGKVIGPHKGWFGAEWRCGQPTGNALRGAHSAGTGRKAAYWRAAVVDARAAVESVQGTVGADVGFGGMRMPRFYANGLKQVRGRCADFDSLPYGKQHQSMGINTKDLRLRRLKFRLSQDPTASKFS